MSHCGVALKTAAALILVGMLAMAASPWVLFSSERDLVVVTVDRMPSDAILELWYGGDTVRLSRDQLKELVLERAKK